MKSYECYTLEDERLLFSGINYLEDKVKAFRKAHADFYSALAINETTDGQLEKLKEKLNDAHFEMMLSINYFTSSAN